jgi:serine protease
MAAPHVSGVVALMLAVNPDLTPDDLDLLLSGTHPGTGIRITEDLGPPGWDQIFGYGLINALSAVRAAIEVTDTPPSQVPALRVTPKDLNFGTSENTLALTAENGGGGTLSISEVSVSDGWIGVNVVGSETNRLVYNVTVDRADLPEGAYSGHVLIISNGGNVTVPVRMRVGQEPSTGGDVGMLYVLLVQPDTLTGVAQANIAKSNNYSFTLNDIPEGQYLLFAGTDMDNNLVIDNNGEAFGGYPVLSRYERIHANTDLTALSFAVSYIVNVQAIQGSDTPDVSIESPGIRRME